MQRRIRLLQMKLDGGKSGTDWWILPTTVWLVMILDGITWKMEWWTLDITELSRMKPASGMWNMGASIWNITAVPMDTIFQMERRNKEQI